MEPFRTTLLRNGAIALAVGAALSFSMGGFSKLPIAFLVALWPSLGGHFVELFFLKFLRPSLPSLASRTVVRLLVWFAGGIVLAYAMRLTGFGPQWWIGGIGFIGIELLAHLFLQLRGKSNFYNSLG
ncbi:MAG: hypothetical protein ABIR70_14120 [Bryobacteraceae bacterium]